MEKVGRGQVNLFNKIIVFWNLTPDPWAVRVSKEDFARRSNKSSTFKKFLCHGEMRAALF